MRLNEERLNEFNFVNENFTNATNNNNKKYPTQLSVSYLRKNFGLKEECKYLFHNKIYNARVYVFARLGSHIYLGFDNEIDFFEFLIEAKHLIDNGIWREISITNGIRGFVTDDTKGLDSEESQCLQCAMKIDDRVQEIFNNVN